MKNVLLNHLGNLRTFPFGGWKTPPRKKKKRRGAASLSSWPPFQPPQRTDPAHHHNHTEPHHTKPRHAAKTNYNDNTVRFISGKSLNENVIIRSLMCQKWRGGGAESQKCFQSLENFPKTFKNVMLRPIVENKKMKTRKRRIQNLKFSRYKLELQVPFADHEKITMTSWKIENVLF